MLALVVEGFEAFTVVVNICRLVSSRGPESSGTSFPEYHTRSYKTQMLSTFLHEKKETCCLEAFPKFQHDKGHASLPIFMALQLVGRDEQAEHGWVEINGPLALEVAHVHLHLRSQSCLAEQF